MKARSRTFAYLFFSGRVLSRLGFAPAGKMVIAEKPDFRAVLGAPGRSPKDGTPIRWSFAEITPNSIRWTGESMNPDGKTWTLQGEFRGKRIL